MNHRQRWFLMFLSVVSIAVALVLLTSARAIQPIRFNHQKHISTVGLTCADCHKYADSQSFAGLPELDVCLGCHQEPQTKSAEEEKLRTLQARGEGLNWNQVYTLPNHVYFSHRRHVAAGQVDCAACHGRMADLRTPLARQIVPISMDRCIKCHQKMKVSTDCLTCHR